MIRDWSLRKALYKWGSYLSCSSTYFLEFVTLAQEIFAIGLQQIKPKVRSIKAENSESMLNVSKT